MADVRNSLVNTADPKATPKGKPFEEQLRESALRTFAFWDNSPDLILLNTMVEIS